MMLFKSIFQTLANRIRSVLVQWPVAAYFVIAFAIPWIGILAITLSTGIPGSKKGVEALFVAVFTAMLAGPLLAAMIMCFALGGWARYTILLRGFMIWRAKPFDYIVITCLIPTCALIILFSLSIVSPDFTPGFIGANDAFFMIVSAMAAGIAVGSIEESGWTGFVTPRLLKKYAALPAAIGLGIAHGVWHFMSNVWFEGAEYGLLFIPYYITCWILAIVVMRILIIWIYSRTKSLLLAGVAHGSHSGGLMAIWPPATSPVQDLIWTTAFGLLGLIAVSTVLHMRPARARR